MRSIVDPFRLSSFRTASKPLVTLPKIDPPSAPQPKIAKKNGAPKVTRTGRRYDSVTMQDRKARILSEAQLLLGEVGYDGFTISELSRRAGVAQGTLYSNMGSKEEIVARAITAHFESILDQMPPFMGRDLASYVDRSSLLMNYTIRLRGYAAAMVSVFFSPGIDARVHAQLEKIPIRTYDDLEAKAVEAKIIRPLSPLERTLLLRHLPHLSYGIVADWITGRLSDLELHARGPVVLLLALYPYFTPQARAEADQMMQIYSKTGLLRPMLTAP